MMKKLLLLLLCWLVPISIDAYAADDLQTLIDATPENGTLALPAGTYEGPVTIDKAITIIGEQGAHIRSEEQGLIVNEVNGLSLQQLSFETIAAPLTVTNSENIHLQHVTFLLQEEAARFEQVNKLSLQNVDVSTESKKHFSMKPNGIDIFQAQNVMIDDVSITNAQDGIYFEHTENVSVSNTTSTFGRYGLHFMYGKEIDVHDNVVSNNVTGLMLMIVEQLQVERNTILRQLMLNSNGLYLYDITKATIRHNEFVENTVATVWNEVKETTFSDNVFQSNSTVIESKRSPEAVVENNEMRGNILTARSDKQLFILRNNEYDDYSGYDFNEDGIGDTAHQTYTSFGQWMVRKPVYQYFIEAPSVVLLNKMDEQTQTTEKNALVDETPVMPNSKSTFTLDIRWGQLVLAIAGIVIILFIWRKQR